MNPVTTTMPTRMRYGHTVPKPLEAALLADVVRFIPANFMFGVHFDGVDLPQMSTYICEKRAGGCGMNFGMSRSVWKSAMKTGICRRRGRHPPSGLIWF